MAMVTSSEATAMVQQRDDDFRLAMEPNTLDQMFKLAAGFAKIGLCGVSTPEEAMARMLAGRELGLSAMTSMMSVYVVKGMPSLSAKLKHALCLARPDLCEQFELIESSNERATFRVKRRGMPAHDYTFTIEDAKRANYIDPKKPESAWNCNPRRMLEARSKGHAADVEFPELLNGLATREEMEDARIVVTQIDRSAAPAAVADVVVDAPTRDTDTELGRLKEDIMNAKTKAEKADVRKRVTAFAADVGEPWASDAKNFYNAHHVAKATNGATAPATPAPAAAPAPASGPAIDADEVLS